MSHLLTGVCALGVFWLSGASAAASEPSVAVLQTITLAPTLTPIERIVDGTIEAVNQATVSAQTAGRVVEVFYDVNDFVPAGAVIVRLRGTEQRASLQQAQAAVVEARARVTETQTQFERVAGLFKDRVVSRQQYDQALTEKESAAARLQAAEAALAAAREGVAYTEVRAPYAGLVTKRHVQVGESVQPGTPLMSGVSLQYLRVNLELPQSVVEKVRALKKAVVYVDAQRIVATRLVVFPEADPSTHTFHARVELPANATDLNPGMFVKVGLVVGEAQRLFVPQSALVQRSEVTGVYVIDAHDKVSLRQIRIGNRYAEQMEVLAGLQAGERIALDPIAASVRVQTQRP